MAKQIGNAVPLRLADVVDRHFIDHLRPRGDGLMATSKTRACTLDVPRRQQLAGIATAISELFKRPWCLREAELFGSRLLTWTPSASILLRALPSASLPRRFYHPERVCMPGA